MKLQSLLNPELRTPAAARISSRQRRSTTVQVMTVVRSGSKLRPQQTEQNIPSLPRPLSVCVSGSECEWEKKSENGCMDRCMDTYIWVLLFPSCGRVLLLSCFVWDTYEISPAITILDFVCHSVSLSHNQPLFYMMFLHPHTYITHDRKNNLQRCYSITMFFLQTMSSFIWKMRPFTMSTRFNGFLLDLKCKELDLADCISRGGNTECVTARLYLPLSWHSTDHVKSRKTT